MDGSEAFVLESKDMNIFMGFAAMVSIGLALLSVMFGHVDAACCFLVSACGALNIRISVIK